MYYYKVVFNIISFILIDSITGSTSPLTFPYGDEHSLNINFKQLPTSRNSVNSEGKFENYGVPTSSFGISDATKLITTKPLLHLQSGVAQDIAGIRTADNQREIKYIPIHSDTKYTGNYISTDIGKEELNGKPIDSNGILLGNGLPNWIMNLNQVPGTYGLGFTSMPYHHHGLGPGLSVKNDGQNNKQYGIYINQLSHIGGAQKDRGEYGNANHLESGSEKPGYDQNVVSLVRKETGEINQLPQESKIENKVDGKETKEFSRNINQLLPLDKDRTILEYLLKQPGTSIFGGNPQNTLSSSNKALYLLQLQHILSKMPAFSQGNGLEHLLLNLSRESSEHLIQGKTTNNEDSSKIVKISTIRSEDKKESDSNKSFQGKFNPENLVINSENSTFKTIESGENSKRTEKGKISKIVKIITIMNHDGEANASNVNQSSTGSSGKEIITIKSTGKVDELKENVEVKQKNNIDKQNVVHQETLSGNQQSEKKKSDKLGKYIVTNKEISVEKGKNSENGIEENNGYINLGHKVAIKLDEESQNLENKVEDSKSSDKANEDGESQSSKATEIINSIYEKEKSGNSSLQETEDGWINSESKGSYITEGMQEVRIVENVVNSVVEEQKEKEKHVNDHNMVERDFNEVQNSEDDIVKENNNINEKLESEDDKKEIVIKKVEDKGKEIIDNETFKVINSETEINEGGTKEPENVESRQEGNKEENNNKEDSIIEEGNQMGGISEEENKEEGSKNEETKVEDISEDENKEESNDEDENKEENNREEGNKIEDNRQEEGKGDEENHVENNREGNKEVEINNEEGNEKLDDINNNEEKNKNKGVKEKENCRKEFLGFYVLTIIKPTQKDQHHANAITVRKQKQSQNVKLNLDDKKPSNDIVLNHKDDEFSVTVQVGGLSSDEKSLIKNDKRKHCDGNRKKYQNRKQNVLIFNKKKNGKLSKLNKHEQSHYKQFLEKLVGQLTVLNVDKTSIKTKPIEENKINYYIIKRKTGKGKNMLSRPNRNGKPGKVKYFKVPHKKENFNNNLEKVKYIVIEDNKQIKFQEPQSKFNFNRRPQRGSHHFVNFERLPHVFKKLLFKKTKQTDESMGSSESRELENERFMLINKNDMSRNRNKLLLNLIQEKLDDYDDEFGSEIGSLSNPIFIKHRHIIKVPNKNKMKKLAKYFLEENNLENENILDVPENYLYKAGQRFNDKKNSLNYIVLRENSIKPENIYRDPENKGQLIEDFSEDYQKYLSLIESSNNPEDIVEISSKD